MSVDRSQSVPIYATNAREDCQHFVQVQESFRCQHLLIQFNYTEGKLDANGVRLPRYMQGCRQCEFYAARSK